MAIGDVKVRCRKCGKPADASEMTLDNELRMMICRECVKDKRRKSGAFAEEKKPEKPAGWDKEDDYLSRVGVFKAAATGQVVQNVGGDKVRVICHKCKFAFNYNKEKKIPRFCPNCGREVIV